MTALPSSFRPTDKNAPVEELRQSLYQHGVKESELLVPKFGETIVVG